MTNHLLIEDSGLWLEVVLNRPRQGNLVTPRMMLTLGNLGERIKARHKAVFITARGDDFCVGREAKPTPGGSVVSAHGAHASVIGPILAVYRALWQSPIPTIAAVRGRAHGFGCGLCGACDVVLAADDATFALPEMAKGIPPTLVMCALKDVNRKTLVDMVYSRRCLDAASAQAAGIVSRCVASTALDGALNTLRDSLASYDREQISYIKEFSDKPGRLAPTDLATLAGYTLATAMSRRA